MTEHPFKPIDLSKTLKLRLKTNMGGLLSIEYEPPPKDPGSPEITPMNQTPPLEDESKLAVNKDEEEKLTSPQYLNLSEGVLDKLKKYSLEQLVALRCYLKLDERPKNIGVGAEISEIEEQRLVEHEARELVRSMKNIDQLNYLDYAISEFPRWKDYSSNNIRKLLLEGFKKSELRRFCYDKPNFGRLLNSLAENVNWEDTVQEIIDYAKRLEIIDELLAWTFIKNQRKYIRYHPYRIVSNDMSFW